MVQLRAMREGADQWYQWLMEGRCGGYTSTWQRELPSALHPIRDSILDRAKLKQGETLLDVGTGDGLIGFGALSRSAPSGRVIFSDISQDLLDHCRANAEALGLDAQCTFVRAGADNLAGVKDGSVDVVTTRAVLIYVQDKAAALSEFYRVLRPGGRASLFETINRLMGVRVPGQFAGYDTRPVAAIAAKISALYESIQPSATDPMLAFDERDLMRFAEDAGFDDIELELRVSVRPPKPMPWDLFRKVAGNPLIPPLSEAMDRVLTAQEAEDFTGHLRPLVESGAGQRRWAGAYVTAVKP